MQQNQKEGVYFHRRGLCEARSIVVKIGSACIVDEDGIFKWRVLDSLAKDAEELKKQGRQIVFVASGAIASVRNSFPHERPRRISAALGQYEMERAYYEAFRKVGLRLATAIINISDITDVDFMTNREIIDAISALSRSQHEALVINENDFAKHDKFNNDMLAAVIAHEMKADGLVFLSTTDGFNDSEGNRINLVEEIDDQVMNMTTIAVSGNGTGGMRSKLEAFQYGNVHFRIIASGDIDRVISRILNGEDVGTLFLGGE